MSTALHPSSVLGGAAAGQQHPGGRRTHDDVAVAPRPERVVQPAANIGPRPERGHHLHCMPVPGLSRTPGLRRVGRQRHTARHHAHVAQHRLPPPLAERPQALRRDQDAAEVQVQLYLAESQVHLLVGVGEVGEDGEVGVEEAAAVDVGAVEVGAGDLEMGALGLDDEVHDEDGEASEYDSDPQQRAARAYEPKGWVRRLRPDVEMNPRQPPFLLVMRVVCLVSAMHGGGVKTEQ